MNVKIKIYLFLTVGLYFGTFLYKVVYIDTNVLTVAAFTMAGEGVEDKPVHELYKNALALFKENSASTQVHSTLGTMEEDYKEWLYGQLLMGKEPDLFLVDAKILAELVEKDAILSLDDMMEAKGFDPHQFYEAALGQGYMNDHQYGIPFISRPQLMAMNTTLLLDNDITLPNSQWTWQDFHALCRKLTIDTNDDGLIDQFGQTGYTWKDAVYANEGYIFNDMLTAAAVTKRNFSNGIHFLYAIQELKEGQETNEQDFEKGNVAFMPMSYSTYVTYKTYPGKLQSFTDFDWSCLSMPAGPDGDNIGQVDSLFFVISKRSKMQDKARDLLTLLTTDRLIQSDIYAYTDGVSPIRTELLRVEQSHSGETMNQGPIDVGLIDYVMERARYSTQIQNYGIYTTIIERNLDEAMTNDVTIQLSLMKMDNEINGILSNLVYKSYK